MKTSLSNTFSTHPPLIEKYTSTHAHPHTPSRRKAKAKGVQNLTGLPGRAPPSAKVQLVYTAASRSSGRDCIIGHATWINASVLLFQVSEASARFHHQLAKPVLQPDFRRRLSLVQHNRWGPGGVSFSPTLHKATLQWTHVP